MTVATRQLAAEALSSLEAATLRYAMHRSGKASLSHEERVAVESALARLNQTLGVGAELADASSEA